MQGQPPGNKRNPKKGEGGRGRRPTGGENEHRDTPRRPIKRGKGTPGKQEDRAKERMQPSMGARAYAPRNN